MIKFACKSDIENIIELWNVAFPEEPDFNKYFFKYIFDYKNTLIYTLNNELAAMAQMLPYEIKGIGRATYIYGAATKPCYRKKGIMSELLKKSFEIDIENGVSASMLIPANKPLFSFYERLGYKTEFYCNKKIYTAESNTDEIRKAEYKDIKTLNDIYKGDVIRSDEYWKKQIDMYNALGGKIFIYKNAYAVVSERIEELMYNNDKDKKILINSVCKFLNCDKIEAIEKGSNVPMGMIKPYSGLNTDEMYMNLMYN